MINSLPPIVDKLNLLKNGYSFSFIFVYSNFEIIECNTHNKCEESTYYHHY